MGDLGMDSPAQPEQLGLAAPADVQKETSLVHPRTAQLQAAAWVRARLQQESRGVPGRDFPWGFNSSG